MSAIRIGLIGHRGDPQLGRLEDELRRRGASPGLIDLTDLPAHANFFWDAKGLRLESEPLHELAAVYARTALFPLPTFVPGRSPAEGDLLTFPVRETGSLLNALVAELARRLPLVNPPATLVYHQQKPFLYSVLQAAGVPVPEFAVGSDLAALAHFVDLHAQQVVVKPLMGGEVFLADFAWLKEHAREVDRRPLLLQRRIVGRSRRGYVVGGRLVALAEMRHGPVIDWRNDLQEIVAVTPGDAEARACLDAAAALGLLFAAIDLEEEPGPPARPWVIDVNPAPMFAGFEARAGLDVAGPLAVLLLELAASGVPLLPGPPRDPPRPGADP